ncbi:hypothetical protein EUTSA_v10009428mg, partial [Eutrema salsugineum]
FALPSISRSLKLSSSTNFTPISFLVRFGYRSELRISLFNPKLVSTSFFGYFRVVLICLKLRISDLALSAFGKTQAMNTVVAQLQRQFQDYIVSLYQQ